MFILLGYEYGYGCDHLQVLGLYETQPEAEAAEKLAKEHGEYLNIYWYQHEAEESNLY